MGDLTLRDLTISLDLDGLLLVHGRVEDLSGRTERAVLDALTTWALDRYMEVLARWTALHADVLRGVVRVGQAGVIGTENGSGFQVSTAGPGVVPGGPIPVAELRALLLVEACRQFIYSTTAQFRALDQELRSLRESAVGASVDQAERISVAANQRIEMSRTARSRLEIAVQTIQNLLENHVDTIAPVRGELADLVLVAEHMASVWTAKEGSLEWVVQHVALRVGIAERRATRSFTAAVFAVAVVAVMRDVVESSLSADIIQWSMYRALVLALGCLAVAASSYVLYVLAKRFTR